MCNKQMQIIIYFTDLLKGHCEGQSHTPSWQYKTPFTMASKSELLQCGLKFNTNWVRKYGLYYRCCMMQSVFKYLNVFLLG